MDERVKPVRKIGEMICSEFLGRDGRAKVMKGKRTQLDFQNSGNRVG